MDDTDRRRIYSRFLDMQRHLEEVHHALQDAQANGCGVFCTQRHLKEFEDLNPSM